MKKKLIILVLALAMVFSVVACGQSGSDTPGGNDSNTPSGNQSSGNQSSGNQSSGGDAKSEIKVGFYQFPNSLEPLSEDLVANFSIVYHVYDRLVRFDPDNNEWLPGIAESWERTAPNVWEFTCNLDYTFSNGDPLTMDDIVWSLLRLKDEPKQAESGAMIKSVTYEGNVLKLEGTTGDNTTAVRVLSAAVIANKNYIENGGDDALYKNPVGTGPYKVTEFTPGSSATLELRDDYPFEKPQIEKITFNYIAETASRYAAVETGQVQYADNFTAFETNLADKDDNLNVLSGDSRIVYMLMMNCEGVFKNENLRKAMAYAFNRDGFCALEGGRKAMASTIFNGYSQYYQESDKLPKFDLNKAKELLAAEGYNESNPLRFTLLCNSNGDPGLEMFQSDLKTIGVEMTIDVAEFSVYLAAEQSASFDMCCTPIMNRGNTPLTDLDRYDNTMFGSRNICRFTTPRVQEIIDQMRFEVDDAVMKELAKELNDIIAEACPIIAVYQTEARSVYDVNLSGVVSDRNKIISFRDAVYAA